MDIHNHSKHSYGDFGRKGRGHELVTAIAAMTTNHTYLRRKKLCKDKKHQLQHYGHFPLFLYRHSLILQCNISMLFGL